jgi:transposase
VRSRALFFRLSKWTSRRQPLPNRVTCGVEMWRGGVGAYLFPAPFVRRCLTSFTMLPFPHPAHRTGWADFPLPALGERFTMSPTGDGAAAC